MKVHEFAAELRLRQFAAAYQRLPASARQTLIDALRELAAGRSPRRVWIYVPDPEDGEPYEIKD